jgi:mannan endo-1,4-beta-mannosidase
MSKLNHLQISGRLNKKQELEDKLKYVSKWMLSHIEDGDKELRKPVMFTEFGSSNQSNDFQPSQRDMLFKTVLDIIYQSAKEYRSGAGALVWQFFAGGMEEFYDEFGFGLWSRPSTYRLITEQSCKLATNSFLPFLD